VGRNDAARTEGNKPLLKWLLLPIVVLAYLASTVSARPPRDRDHDRLPDRWERKHHLSTVKPSAKRDPDRDRLRNRRELRLRTHPRRADTDRDGLRDGAEVRRFRTNPRKRDTDGDGFRDRCELRKGTNPRRRRSHPKSRCSKKSQAPSGRVPPPPSASPRPSSPASDGVKYGFHQDLGYFGDQSYWNPRLDAVAGIGAEVTRSTLLWRVVEPSNDNFNFSRYDALLAQTAARGLDSVLVLASSPQWANGSADPWHMTPDQAAFSNLVAEYAEFAGRVAARYAGRGLHYEIWNEPNERFFWTGSAPNVDRYAQLFSAARNAMLRADPGAKVGLGGITGLGASCCLQGIDFIAGLVDRGVQFSYAGIHTYDSGLNDGPDTHIPHQQNFDDVLAVERMLNARGRPNVKLWVTEWGWSSCSLDAATKAAWLKRGQERIRDEWSSFVTLSTYFMDQDQPAYPCAGVFTSSLARKPLATAFEQFQGG
jgi:Glycosyl hydrolases family 39/Bacterial TSP3 repeat